jgi:TetR/AcrR family transcriptional regulator, tetracycline repressor protein
MPLHCTPSVTPSDLHVSSTPRGRGRPPSLSEDEIVTAALRLTRDVGLQNLSMRALARALDVPPMTIYHYVTSKESLHALVVDHILHDIAVPEADGARWEERLAHLLADARRVFADHPGVSSRLGDPGTTEGSRLAVGVLGILDDGGFASDAAVVCFATLFTFMTGQIDLDAMADAIANTAPPSTLEGVTRSTRFSRDELFELGCNAVIEGLKQTLLSEDRAQVEAGGGSGAG